MINCFPNYYKNFFCIGSKCTDNCCIGWEIDIDDNTYDYYINVAGSFGNRLKKSIDNKNKAFILGENERCPFLNKDNLCDVILNLGENKLCHICAHHPRFYNTFGRLNEGGIGLCCEEAGRLILTNKEPFSLLIEEDDKIADDDIFDEGFLEEVLIIRQNFINIIQDKNIFLEEKLLKILNMSQEIQNNIDNITYDEKIISIKKTEEFENVINFYKTLEVLDESWTNELDKILVNFENINKSISSFDKYYNDKLYQFENLAVYFIYRHLIACTNDYDLLSRAILCVLSVFIIKMISINKWLENGEFTTNDLINVSKAYSKEIEYSMENLTAFSDNTFENFYFKIMNIKSLLI